MKESTLSTLTLLIRKGNLNVDSVSELFNVYSSFELCTKEDLLVREHKDFFDFIKANISFFKVSAQFDAITNARHLYYKTKFLSGKNYIDYRKTQEDFVEEIKCLVGEDKSTKILEVGSGTIPYSSILLGTDGYNISSMDNFSVSKECLKSFNVKSCRQLFNEKARVKQYDVVVGRKPCSAILPIVSKCTSERVPYFIRLCGCELPSKSVYGWRDILDEIDRDIKYKGAYAYNLNNAKFNPSKSMTDIIEMDCDKIMV